MNEIINFSLNPALAQFILYLVIILVLSYLIDYFLLNSFFGQSYRIFVAPGVIVHELSHALLCFLTGAEIMKISYFEKNGGSVTHGQPKIFAFGMVLISLAPFFIGLALIILFSRWLGLNNSITIGELGLGGVISYVQQAIQGINWHNALNWVLLYLIISIAITMVPSAQDIKNALLAMVLSAIIIWVVYSIFPFPLSFPPAFIEKTFIILTTVIIILVLSLFLSFIIFLISKIFNH